MCVAMNKGIVATLGVLNPPRKAVAPAAYAPPSLPPVPVASSFWLTVSDAWQGKKAQQVRIASKKACVSKPASQMLGVMCEIGVCVLRACSACEWGVHVVMRSRLAVLMLSRL
jgi:hypothetical protein